MTTLNHFFNYCKFFVESYPQSNEACKRLQTFAVIESESDLNSPNLGKTINDKHKPFFWSRDWASANYSASKLVKSYPLFAMFEQNIVLDDIISPSMTREHSLELLFLDKYYKDCTDSKNICGKRTRNEIYQDTEVFLMHFLTYLRDLKVLNDGSIAHKTLANRPDIDDVATIRFLKMLNSLNKQVSAQRWDGGIDDLYGNVIPIRIELMCNPVPYHPLNIKEYKNKPDGQC